MSKTQGSKTRKVNKTLMSTIEEILSMQACFPTYSRYRGYCKRVQSAGRVFLWNGLYYEVSEQCRDKLLSLLKQCSK